MVDFVGFVLMEKEKVWAKQSTTKQHNIESADIADALHAIDRISHECVSQQTDENSTSDLLTYGSIRQRICWFTTGYDLWSFEACDTFITIENRSPLLQPNQHPQQLQTGKSIQPGNNIIHHNSESAMDMLVKP